MARGMGDIVAASGADQVPWFRQLTDSLTQLGTAYLTLQQQKQLLEINAQRAREGLSPISVSQYAAGVNVGVDTSTRNTVLIVGLGLAAALVISGALGRRR